MKKSNSNSQSIEKLDSKSIEKKESKLINSLLSGSSSDEIEKSDTPKEYRVQSIKDFKKGDFVEFQSAQNNKSYHGEFVNGIITHFVHDPKVGKDFIHIITEDKVRLCKESSKVTLIK